MQNLEIANYQDRIILLCACNPLMSTYIHDYTVDIVLYSYHIGLIW